MVLKILSTSSVYLVIAAHPFVYLTPHLVGLVGILVLVGLTTAIPVNPAPYASLSFRSREKALTDDRTAQAHVVCGLGAFLVGLIPVEENVIFGTRYCTLAQSQVLPIEFLRVES